MKFAPYKKVALAVAGLFFAAPSFGVELITNGIFDGSLSGWTTANSFRQTSASYDIFTPGDGVLFVSNTCPAGDCTKQGDGFFNQTVNVPVTGTYGLTFDYGIRALTGASVIGTNTNTLSISYDGSLVGTMQFTRDLATSSISINRSGTISTRSFAVDTSYPFSASYSLSSSSGTKALEFTYDNKDIFFFIDNISFSLNTPSGPSATDTQAALAITANRLRASYNKISAASHFPTSNTYDCNLFDARGMCVSAGGRYTYAEGPHSHSTAGVVVLGYKVSPSIRIGGFLDQSVSNDAPTGIQISNKNPMMGAFVYWNQNPNELGYQVKLANTYQDKDLTLTRDVLGTSESGTGKTGLMTQSYVGELSYAFMYKENTLVRPYFGLRYTSINQDAYTETGVTTPLTYSKLKDETIAALMGVKLKHQLTEKTTLTGSLGIEQDIDHKVGNFEATGLSGLTSENFSGGTRHNTRALASLGAYYSIAKSQRLSGEVMFQQLPFQNSMGGTVYANYMIGF